MRHGVDSSVFHTPIYEFVIGILYTFIVPNCHSYALLCWAGANFNNAILSGARE